MNTSADINCHVKVYKLVMLGRDAILYSRKEPQTFKSYNIPLGPK